MQEFRTKIITLLAVFEREVPDIFMHAYPHCVIHVPAQIFRWGSARTIWCFFLERYESNINALICIYTTFFALICILCINIH